MSGATGHKDAVPWPFLLPLEPENAPAERRLPAPPSLQKLPNYHIVMTCTMSDCIAPVATGSFSRAEAIQHVVSMSSLLQPLAKVRHERKPMPYLENILTIKEH
jgi:hypothetical protein